jgi:hypothetical protein
MSDLLPAVVLGAQELALERGFIRDQSLLVCVGGDCAQSRISLIETRRPEL